MTIIAATAATTTLSNNERIVPFDSDSRLIGIDNRCTACISHDIRDFVGHVEDTNIKMRGYAGTRTKPLKRGTLRWSWSDDTGKVFKFHIPNSYYCPQGKVRLLSSQHWAKVQRDFKPRAGTTITTTHESIDLRWDQRRYKLTVPLGRNDNVATFHLASGMEQYYAYCTQMDQPSTKMQGQHGDDSIMWCQPTQMVSDDDEDDDDVDRNDPTVDEPVVSERTATKVNEAMKRIGNIVDTNLKFPRVFPETKIITQHEFDLDATASTDPPPIIKRKKRTSKRLQRQRNYCSYITDLVMYHFRGYNQWQNKGRYPVSLRKYQPQCAQHVCMHAQ